MVVNDVDASAADETATSIRHHGGQAVVHVGAVQHPGTGPELTEIARSEFGAFDAMILNAGVMDVTPAVDCAPEAMRAVVEINVLGTMFCGVPALREMTEQGHGSLVLVASGARFGMTGLSVYGATKGAVASLVWSWAAETALHGVRVNAISPLAQTAMFALNPTVSAGPAPERIAPAAVYLVSEANLLTGQIVRFDGDSLSLYLQHGGTMTDAVSRSHWSSRDIADAVAEITGNVR